MLPVNARRCHHVQNQVLLYMSIIFLTYLFVNCLFDADEIKKNANKLESTLSALSLKASTCV